ncbi:hypothetical protein ABZS61_18515 [Streptomyces sp. NPDC005566]|uniref:hypothetical protein n=1 Tax=Streptomyces sp. NPDC005566 TaxID=3156886 RepID=UPI0033A41B2C
MVLLHQGRLLADDPRAEAAQLLRAARRRLLDDDIDGAMLEARRALERIKERSGWKWPGGKDRLQRTQDERWAWIRFAVEDQTSAAVHRDAVTSAFTYSRNEARALVSIAAALLTVVDEPPERSERVRQPAPHTRAAPFS